MSSPLFARVAAAAAPEPSPHAAAPALRFGAQTLTYAQLARAVAAHLARLEARGVAPGAHVAVWTQPSLETLVALVGNALVGHVSVPLNPALGERELAHVLDDARPALALCADDALASCAERAGPRVATEPFAPLEAPVAPPTRVPRRAVDDAPALLLYTSGTTGAPKGALLTARNIASNLAGLADAWGLGEGDTIVHALPVFHVHGLVLGLFGALEAGACLRWLERFEPLAVADALREAPGRTVLYAVPTMYHRLADAAERDERVGAGLRAARLLVSGSAALPAREHARLERAAGVSVRERYGLTETLINTALRADEPARPGSVGRAVAGVEVRLVDDARAPLAASAYDGATLGELAVRGPNVFAGYHRRDDATAAVRDEAGWFYTGDLATIDAEGYVRIAGRRATDLLKTGGFKVGAGEVEAALLEHPAVAECAVLGVPDEDLGERIVAYVVRRPTDDGSPSGVDGDALASHVARLLAPHKRPREVRFCDELPRNAMGKVRKAALRERYDAEAK